MQVLIKKILVLLLASISLYLTAAVPVPVFKWRNGGNSNAEYNKGMYTSPALLDIDRDGSNEVIWASFKVSAFDGVTGDIVWSFWAGNDRAGANTYYGIGTDTNVAVADINNDGFGEIVTAHTNGLVCAYDRNGYFLPGFPLYPTGRTDPIGSLSVFDLDNDGDHEIIIGWAMANNLNVCVIHHDGTIMAGWPQYVLNPNANALGIFGENIAVGDINRDGFGELVAPSDTGKTCAYYYNGTALPINPVFTNSTTNMTSWPNVVNYEDYTYEKFGWLPNGLFYMGTEQPATIADVDADGSFEIVIVGVVYTNPDDWDFQPLYTKPFIYNLDRTRFNSGIYNWEGGLPQSGAPLSNDWNVIARKRTNPVVVDLDGDGNREILSSSFDGKLHCYWLDRTEHGNWPYSVTDPAEGRIRFSSEPAVADLDGDGSLEVIFTSWPQYYTSVGGHLFILNSQGSLLHKVALPYDIVGALQYDGGLAAPTIGDADGDGQPEIVLGTVYAGLVVYDLPGAVMGSAPWPTGRHDYARTGWTDYVSNISALNSVQVLSPNGGENWNSGSVHNITWSTTGTGASVSIDYSINGGGSWISVISGTANDGSHGWTVPATLSPNCLVRVSDMDNDPSDASDRVFSISATGVETVSIPSTPTGPASGPIGSTHSYSTGGSASNLGHALQYLFDWGDGTNSGWREVGITSASKSWSAAGTYNVRAKARCATHTTIESLWSTTLAVIIYAGGGVSGAYNSPAQYKVLPEVIWAQAAGGGTWMSEVQLTDVSGGSQINVYYNTATGRRGPFLLWNNSGGALSSSKYSNLLKTIDGLDSGTFTYYGTVGAVEFITQDGSHAIHAAARTVNGSCAKTFTAVSLHDANTADTSRTMIIPNLTNNATYRSSCGFFNPTDASVTMDLKLRNAANAQVGSTISKTLAGHEFISYAVFTEAGVPYPGTSSDNIVLHVTPTSGTGKVVCFGASANNTSNDPAAHVAVQNASSYDNGPSSLQVMPEAVWASASGGGTWVTEVQVVDASGGSVVSVYFNYIGGVRRGPFTLWTGTAAGSKVKYTNILQQLGTLDGGYTYYGKGGTVEFATQDGSHTIQVTARTVNGNYAKTFPGLNMVDAETADTTRVMLIQNYTNNVTYRSTCGFYNPTADAITVEYTLLNSSGVQIGSPFSKTLVGHDFISFSPFAEAGVAYPANSYDNVILRVRPTSGAGKVMCFGASANNASNDPASHLAVQAE